MSPSRFSFDIDERAIERMARDAGRKAAADHQRDLNRLSQQLQGRPLDEIRTALQQLYRSKDGSIKDPELAEYAKLIQDGTRFDVTAR